MLIPIDQIILRIVLAFILSLIFGLERQFKKKPVGVGTFTFVATGSCILTILAYIVSDTPHVIIGPIITGIGFLGAGALIRQDRKVHGATTAASIWGFAALGIVIGSGIIYLGLIFYAFIMIIVFLDSFFERHSFGPYSKYLTVTLTNLECFKGVKANLPRNTKVQNFNFDKSKNEYVFSFILNAKSEELSKIPNKILNIDGVKTLKLE
ncbi:MAG: MgtC/SapB family protein [Candidatus Aenigmatarchaeota archaeon]|nr:MgtC/SapB family protein [Candidatus Aenigmarchaeota archaeon]